MSGGKRRSLILAGGGLKVAFQAGVLQVWLDEAQLSFDHADAASGGVFNLAMWCQGCTGTQIADRWRDFDPKAGLEFNWSEYLKLFYARSLFRMDKFQADVFTKWGYDWDLIRATDKEATFNVYNFTDHELEVIEAKDMDEELLVACVSLPMWFPPVERGGKTYIDSVFYTDANIPEAIRRGADELWIIWTVSDAGEWYDGFVANYFQIIEASANGEFKKNLARIAENNAAVARGQSGEFGRNIDVKVLKSEVPLNYLVNFSRDRITEAVNLGVERARAWCRDRQIPLKHSGGSYPTEVHEAQTKLWFTEEMKGYVSIGETDYDAGYEIGRQEGTSLSFKLTITVEGVNRFVVSPQHEATTQGWIECQTLGGHLEVSRGIFNLFVAEDEVGVKRMLYRLFFEDGAGHPLTLSGFKLVRDDPGLDLWSDTSTLYVRILRGHVAPNDEASAEIVASGIIKILMLDFLQQLTTFRVEGPTASDRAAALTRFGRLFLGKLWDVYAREILPASPV